MLTEKERPRVIVLVESNQMLQELMKRFLADQAYSVFAERDGKGGLWYFEHYPGPIDLLIADVVLPDQNGVTFAHLVKDRYPETRILLTGYVEPALQEEVNLLGVSLLAKPFKRRQFLTVVADLLRNPAPPGAEDKNDTGQER